MHIFLFFFSRAWTLLHSCYCSSIYVLLHVVTSLPPTVLYTYSFVLLTLYSVAFFSFSFYAGAAALPLLLFAVRGQESVEYTYDTTFRLSELELVIFPLLDI
ncbi:hypothetical protein C8R47DRAFT_14503 [Mycena vitilis]|nr:hypothetical protein C8R47DRAFT_14503 [Mycena vitilis]